MSLIRPILTEKSSANIGLNKYTFEVNQESNKIEIRREVEDKFSVNVIAINIVNRVGKKKRRGKISGKSKDKKLAIVTIKKGQSIEDIKGLV